MNPYRACADGDVDAIRALFDTGALVAADFCVPVDDGSTPVHAAAEHNHPGVVWLLHERGVNIDVRHEKAWYTPLVSAAKGGHKLVAEALLSCGASVEGPGYYGCSPLGAACEMGHWEVAEVLLDHNADVNTKFARNADGSRGMTPLHVACGQTGPHFSIDLVKLLIARGADMGALTAPGSSPLVLACAECNTSAVEVLLNHGANVGANPNGLTPLFMASFAGDEEAVQLLLAHGADKDQSCTLAKISNAEFQFREALKQDFHLRYPQSPLTVACRRGHVGVVRRLLNAGVYVDADGRGGFTPLCGACAMGHLEVADLLLKRGANANAMYNCNTDHSRGSTPLHIVCLRDPANIDMVKLLLAARARIECCDAAGMTPLMIACQRDDAILAQALLDAGASVGEALGGNTPLFVASLNGSEAAVRVLLRHGANVDQVGGFDPESEDDDDDSSDDDDDVDDYVAASRLAFPLAAAFRAYHHGVVRQLLDAGANPVYALGSLGGMSAVKDYRMCLLFVEYLSDTNRRVLLEKAYEERDLSGVMRVLACSADLSILFRQSFTDSDFLSEVVWSIHRHKRLRRLLRSIVELKVESCAVEGDAFAVVNILRCGGWASVIDADFAFASSPWEHAVGRVVSRALNTVHALLSIRSSERGMDFSVLPFELVMRIMQLLGPLSIE